MIKLKFNHLFCLKWIFIFIDTLFSYYEVRILDMYFSNQFMFPLYDYVDGKVLGDCVHSEVHYYYQGSCTS